MASASAFNDEGDADYLHASVSGMEQRFMKLAHVSIQLSLFMLSLLLPLFFSFFFLKKKTVVY